MIYTQKILLERSDRGTWVGQVADVGEKIMHTRLVAILNERGDVKDLDIDGSITFTYIVFYNLL
jgi:hypothetical protein